MNIMISDSDIVYMELKDNSLMDYYFSKLCFLNNLNYEHGEMLLIGDANELFYDKENKVYFFPKDINEYQRCFLLRLVVDSVQLKRGNLPLHAAAFSDGKTTFVIAAESGMGKSFIADQICKMFPMFYTIGDDHIIISSSYIQGNMKRRIRDISGKEDEYIDNVGLDKLHKVIFINFEVSNNNGTKKISKEEAFSSFTNASAFKYLNEIFNYKNREYGAENITDININYKYQNMFYKYVDKNEAIYISGKQQYAVEHIAKIIDMRK